MKIVIFGLTITSSWGNGHATLWRGLCGALAKLGHQTVFIERNTSYYANTRDWEPGDGCRVIVHDDWAGALPGICDELDGADVAIVTSYCADAIEASREILDRPGLLRIFYDLDSPVTIAAVRAGRPVSYLLDSGLREFDLVLSYAGGETLQDLATLLGASQVYPLYGHVDHTVHRPMPRKACYRSDLSYLGTYAADRQQALETLFVEPSRRRPDCRFLLGGAQYPADFPWTENVYFVHHLPPPEHAAFFCSSRITLNVTRAAMVKSGYCPSGRLFEAAACGTPVLSDEWIGLGDFYAPGTEVLVGRCADDVIDALERSDAELKNIGQRARERTLTEHTSHARAVELVSLLEAAASVPMRRSRRPVDSELLFI
jgi:spore maturation protein CgeB